MPDRSVSEIGLLDGYQRESMRKKNQQSCEEEEIIDLVGDLKKHSGSETNGCGNRRGKGGAGDSLYLKLAPGA
jgi:hypothetical protein